MDCREFERALSEQERIPGYPLPRSLAEHLENCPHCRGLMLVLAQSGPAFSPSPALIDAIKAKIAGDPRPVTPVPAGSHLVAMFALIFLTLVGLGLLVLRPLGLVLMSGWMAASILGVLTICAGLLISSLSRQMVPGSLYLVSPAWPVCGTWIILVVLFAVSLPHDPSPDFWKRGWICLAIGLAFALPAGTLFAQVLRRGAVMEPLLTGASAGLLAGLVGVAVLEIHCPILESWHALAWHMGAAAAATLTGTVLSRLWNE